MCKTNKKGITLVELVTVLALLLVIGASVGAFIFTFTKQCSNIMQVNQAKRTATVVFTDITTHLRYAKGMSANEDTSGTGVYYSENGRIYLNGTDLYNDDFYGAQALELQWALNGKAVTVTLTVSFAGKQVYTVDSAVQPLNMKSTATGSGSVLHYIA